MAQGLVEVQEVQKGLDVQEGLDVRECLECPEVSWGRGHRVVTVAFKGQRVHEVLDCNVRSDERHKWRKK